MRLEQTLEMYRPSEIYDEKKTYTFQDLEYLSASALYIGGPLGSGPLMPRSRPLMPKFSEPLRPIPKPEPISIPELNLDFTGKSYKILDSGKGGSPVTRLDLKPHEFGNIHLQHGERDYFGRNGDEAADLFAEILRLNPKIKFPGEK
jgi:hypothetical protein